MRNIQANSLKDYNQQVCKVQKIVRQLKLATANLNKTSLQHNDCTNYLLTQAKVLTNEEKTVLTSSQSPLSKETYKKNVKVGKSNVGTIQRFIGRIRRIF